MLQSAHETFGHWLEIRLREAQERHEVVESEDDKSESEDVTCDDWNLGHCFLEVKKC